jgi:hypothetical protein
VAAAERILLGKVSSLSSRQKVFRTPDAVEVEETEGYDLTRRRVWFDEVLLVTYHREVGWAFVVTMLALSGIFGFPGLLMLIAQRSLGVAIYFAIAVLPFAIALGLRLALRLDVVTVYGRRTKAQVHFWFGKAQARRVYQEVTRLARERQPRPRVSTGVRPPPPPSAPPSGPPSLPPSLPPTVPSLPPKLG